MKRCQDDNPYYQETLDRDFSFFYSWRIGGWWEGNNKAKRDTEKGNVLKKKQFLIYV